MAIISLKFEHLRLGIFPWFENFEIKIKMILFEYEMIECGLHHDENGYLCKSER